MKLPPEQQRWCNEFSARLYGLVPCHIDALNAGNMPFADFKRCNLLWAENHFLELVKSLENWK